MKRPAPIVVVTIVFLTACVETQTSTQAPDTPLLPTAVTAPNSGIAFADSGQSLGNGRSSRVVLGDLNGDGNLDAVVANERASEVWFNDGAGVFTSSEQTLGSISGMELLDIDEDGDLDLLSAGKSIKLWHNDGNGVFTSEIIAKQEGAGVAVGDIDSDGDADAIIACMGIPNQIWLNNGEGEFIQSNQAIGSSEIMYDDSLDILLSDLDGDEDLDAFEVNYGGYHRTWLNDGRGTFTIGIEDMYAGDHSHGIALGDLNGDGYIDAFVTTTDDQAFGVWFNNGAGTLTEGGQAIPETNPAQGVALGDLDGDGDLDAFIAHSGHSDAGYTNTIWLNDGDGNFTDSGLRLRQAYSLGIALGDLDGDGDLDAFIVNSYFNNPTVDSSNRVWFNESP